MQLEVRVIVNLYFSYFDLINAVTSEPDLYTYIVKYRFDTFALIVK